MAFNRAYTVKANRTPSPSAIHRSCGEKAVGLSLIRSHAAMTARPTTLRHESNVSTSPPSANTALLRTLAHAKADAPRTAGPRSLMMPTFTDASAFRHHDP